MHTNLLRSARLLRNGALVLCTAGSFALASCGREMRFDRTCEVEDDCHSSYNNWPGTECINQFCECPEPGHVSCCHKGAVYGDCQMACRLPVDCAGGDDNGSGGSGEPEVPPECSVDKDCQPQPDPHCGTAKCIEEKCVYEIKIGATASQVRGDCARQDCNWFGSLVTLDDPSDYRDDGNLCTEDMCLKKVPQNIERLDGSSCSTQGSGFCYQGSCVECIQPLLGITQDCGSGFVCDYIYCVPNMCSASSLCGNGCKPCPLGHSCDNNKDCKDGVCSEGTCAEPTCADAVKNDSETGVDCGGLCSAKCSTGDGCKEGSDCESLVCWAGKCQTPTCIDGTLNEDELGPDCGGSCPDACP